MTIAVMVNGMPGNMAREVGQVVLDRGYTLIPFSLTGEVVEDKTFEVQGQVCQLLKPSERDAVIDTIKADYPGFITVDYTHPSAVNENADFYIKNDLPFVMGTTGGDREKLLADVETAGLYAVIAPNMGKQIVAFQTMMEYVATNFPGVFNGYKLDVVEAHQSGKADTSGTAKAVVASMNNMGLDYDVEQIEKVRDADGQMNRMNVPEESLDGHAFHTYTITSNDGSVEFQFKHNVCGRRFYAEGTVDGVEFLSGEIKASDEKKLYNMMDVLKSGAMK